MDIEELKLVTSVCNEGVGVYVEVKGLLKEVKDYEYFLEDNKFVLKLIEE